MTEMGEMSQVAIDRAKQGRCVQCGKSHKNPKHADLPLPVKTKADGWLRAPGMQSRDASRPGDAMHHAVAFSAFCVGTEKPKDFVPEINRLLHKAGYQPNRQSNCVALPGPDHADGSYGYFCERLRSRAPLQPHLGRHKSAALNASKAMVLYTLRYLVTDGSDCARSDQEEMKGDAKTLIQHAEDYASDATLRYLSPFRLHPNHLEPACTRYVGGRGKAAREEGAQLAASLEKRWAAKKTGLVTSGNPFVKGRWVEGE